MEKFLEVAIAAATASAEVIRGYYRGDFTVEIKADQSPVTGSRSSRERAEGILISSATR